MELTVKSLLEQPAAAAAPAEIEKKIAACPTLLTHDLKVGTSGEAVRELQKYLNDSGYPVAVSGPGSKGQETSYFGVATQAALVRFQKDKGIAGATGIFDQATRDFLGCTSFDSRSARPDASLAGRLKGWILLRVEGKGEAYYVYPATGKKYYLGTPANAFGVMKALGLGATHKFISGYQVYPDKVLGRILIDVDDSGKAYYIYPKDKKAYYLGSPDKAWQVMRSLGLGISDIDLDKIAAGDLSR